MLLITLLPLVLLHDVHAAVFSFSDLAVDDTHCNPLQDLTFSGRIYWDGSPLPYGTVKILLGESVKGVGGGDGNGWFSIAVTAESSVNSYTYVAVGEYLNGSYGGYSDFPEVIVDAIYVVGYSVSASVVNINTNVNIDATLIYGYSATTVTTGTISINGYSASYQGSGVYRITRTSSTPTSVTYNTVAGSEATYDLDTVNQNGQNATVKWENYTISLLAVPASPLINDVVTFTLGVKRSNGTAITNFYANITKDGSPFKTNWNTTTFTDTETNIQSHIYNVTAVYVVTDSVQANFTSPTVTVAWQGASGGEGGGAGGGGGAVAQPTPTPTETAAPSPTPWTWTPPELPADFIQTIIIGMAIILAAILLATSLVSRQRKYRRSARKFDKNPKLPHR